MKSYVFNSLAVAFIAACAVTVAVTMAPAQPVDPDTLPWRLHLTAEDGTPEGDSYWYVKTTFASEVDCKVFLWERFGALEAQAEAAGLKVRSFECRNVEAPGASGALNLRTLFGGHAFGEVASPLRAGYPAE